MTDRISPIVDAGSDVDVNIGFSRRTDDPPHGADIFIPGYPDNPVNLFPCRVRDARRLSGDSLAREGFSLVRHVSTTIDDDIEKMRVPYHDEVAALLSRLFQPDLVVPSYNGLLVRRGEQLIDNPIENVGGEVIPSIPASFAHIDYLAEQAHDNAEADRQIAGIPAIPYSRLQIIQTWRAISPPPQDVPLALCDRRTMKPSDISKRTGVLQADFSVGMESNLFYLGGIHHDPAQAWYYYPDMSAEDLLIFVGYDSDAPDFGRVAHAAFDNRSHSPNAASRQSIEARFYLYYR